MESTEESSTKCKFFVKKGQSKRQNRRNQRRESSSSDDESSAVVMSGRRTATNPLIQSTHSFDKLKKRKTNCETNDDNDSNDSNEESISVSYRSKKTAHREGPEDMGATAIVETETEKSKDAQSIFEKALRVNETLKGKEDDRIYRGLNNYTQYMPKKDTPQGNASSGYVRKGPVRAPENIRSTVRWDYQPDLCKDYKETGFCGFGESCIFLHDRTDYKSGWQLELEAHSTAQTEDANQYVIAEDDDLPFKCFICRQSFECPVVTRCKHYFCEKCALNHFKTSGRCYVCGQQTLGVFNVAKDIVKRLKHSEDTDLANDDNQPNDIPDDQQSNDSDSQ